MAVLVIYSLRRWRSDVFWPIAALVTSSARCDQKQTITFATSHTCLLAVNTTSRPVLRLCLRHICDFLFFPSSLRDRSGYALKIVSTSNLFLLVYVFLIHACLTLTDCNLKQESGQRCNLIAIENFLWRKRCRISAYDISYTFHPILNWMYNICCHADGSSLPNLSISL